MGFDLQKVSINGEALSTNEWNPMHFAINEKKISVVRYFLDTLKVDARRTIAASRE
jgi:hypothetical protein